MRHLQNYLQHRLNPLHVYCRLCSAGLSERTAYRVCGVYERLYRFFSPSC